MKRHALIIGAVLTLLLVACGGSDDTVTPTTASAGDASAEDLAQDLADDLVAAQQAAGGGSATLTVGDQTWDFGSVLCAFGEEQIGQEGAELVVSSIADGMQFYVSIDRFGHSVSLDDIEDFENPSVSVRSSGDNFIELDGKNFSGTADFLDGTSDSFEAIPGSFSGSCP